MARPKRFELLTPRFVVWCWSAEGPAKDLFMGAITGEEMTLKTRRENYLMPGSYLRVVGAVGIEPTTSAV
jgi:hypothetical protein